MAEWTDTCVATLRELWAEGQTARVIAARLRAVSRNAVIGKARRLGLPSRKGDAAQPRARRPRARRPRPLSLVVRGTPPRTPRPPAASLPVLLNAPEPLGITVLELTRGTCKWPSGDPRGGQAYRFCGHQADGTYCAFHHQLGTRSGARRAA